MNTIIVNMKITVKMFSRLLLYRLIDISKNNSVTKRSYMFTIFIEKSQCVRYAQRDKNSVSPDF